MTPTTPEPKQETWRDLAMDLATQLRDLDRGAPAEQLIHNTAGLINRVRTLAPGWTP